ncbi:MAG: DUF1611 domain-containing protein [Vulcanimicrobiaceae bacterium]
MSAGSRRYAILAPDLFASRSAKTAHGVIAYGRDEVACVIDPAHAGRRVRDAVPYLDSDAPIVASLDDALACAPTALLVGVAPPGGALPPAWRAPIVATLEGGLEVVSGLHHLFAADAEFAAAARRGGASIWDVRTPPAPRLFSGEANHVAPRVILTVGSDCAVGKMTASLELTRAAGAAGARARFVATGQTGIMIAGSGTAIDRVIADFASGAAEELVLAHASRDDARGEAAPDLLFVEGQGGINHAAFAPVTLALLYGACPDALVLVHLATRTHVDGVGTPLLSLSALVRTYEALCASVKPAAVAGIALNTHGLDDPSARAAIAAATTETGLPCDDVVRFGPERLFTAIRPALAHKTAARS